MFTICYVATNLLLFTAVMSSYQLYPLGRAHSENHILDCLEGVYCPQFPRTDIHCLWAQIAVIIKLILKPIFHLKTGLRWVPDANEIYTKNMKCTCPTRQFCIGTQRNLYFTGLCLGFTSGKTQLLGFASGKNAKNWRHPTPEIPTCWYILRWVKQNSGVGCTAQRQPPTPGILRSGGI